MRFFSVFRLQTYWVNNTVGYSRRLPKGMCLSLHYDVLGLAVLSQFLDHTISATGSLSWQGMARFVGCAAGCSLRYQISSSFPVESKICHCFRASCLPSNRSHNLMLSSALENMIMTLSLVRDVWLPSFSKHLLTNIHFDKVPMFTM